MPIGRIFPTGSLATAALDETAAWIERHRVRWTERFDLRGVAGTKGDGFFYDGWAGALDSLEDHLIGAR